MPTLQSKGLCDELREAAVTPTPELNPEQERLTARAWAVLGKFLPLVGTACREGFYITGHESHIPEPRWPPTQFVDLMSNKDVWPK